jgi:hypothetical protein
MIELPGRITLPRGLLTDIYRDPTYALETIALASVTVHGPAAKRWVQSRHHLRYSHDQLAKSALRRSTNSAFVEGAALGLGGFITAVPDAAALVWILSREAIFVAAAYGHDPTHPDRAAEVLVICDVYPDLESAKAGLERRGQRLPLALAKQQTLRFMSPGGNRTAGSRLVRYATARFAKNKGARMVPGLGSVLGAIDNSASARRIGQRAMDFYKARS